MRLILIISFVLPLSIQAAIPTPGSWLVWFGTQNLNKKLFLHTETQIRFYQPGSDLEQVLLRGGLGLNHSSGKAHALAGFCYVYGETYTIDGAKLSTREYRPFQQAVLKHQQNKLVFIHRLRLEQRFLQGAYSDRMRYFLSVNYLLNHQSFEKNTFYLSAYNEVFIQSHRTSIFDQNRIYGALGWAATKGLRLELGYMSQIFSARAKEQIMLVLFQQMNFYKTP